MSPAVFRRARRGEMPSKSNPAPKKRLASSYSKFQALGFSIYTGRAPVFVGGEDDYGNNKKMRNHEYRHSASLGHLGQFGDDEEPTDHLYCYVGLPDNAAGVSRRLEVMRAAVETARPIRIHPSSR